VWRAGRGQGIGPVRDTSREGRSRFVREVNRLQTPEPREARRERQDAESPRGFGLARDAGPGKDAGGRAERGSRTEAASSVRRIHACR